MRSELSHRKIKSNVRFHVLTCYPQLNGCLPSVLPKQNSIFAFAVPLYSTLSPTHTPNMSLRIFPVEKGEQTVLDGPHIDFELYGNQFRFRSAERAGRKFKPKETIEL